MTWDDTKIEDSGASAAGRLSATEYNELVTAVKARLLKSLYNANTIIKSDTEDTPAALEIAEQTLVGRITGGLIEALSPAQIWTIINVLDEDNMVSDSDTSLATQQSIKKYVDDSVISTITYRGGYNAATNTPDLDTSPSGVLLGDMYIVTVAGTFFTTAVVIGDALIANTAGASIESDWDIVSQYVLDASGIPNTPAGDVSSTDVQAAINELDTEKLAKSLYDANTLIKSDSDDTPIALTVDEQRLVGRITAGVITALTAAQVRTLLNVENGADVTDTANVDSAGAAMNSDKNIANGVAGLDASAMLEKSQQNIICATAEDTRVNPATGTCFAPERVNDDDVGTLSTFQPAGEYLDIVFPAKAYIKKYRHYGMVNHNQDGTYKIQHYEDGAWVDNTVGISTILAAWSPWTALTVPVFTTKIRVVAVTIDTYAGNNNVMAEIEFRG